METVKEIVRFSIVNIAFPGLILLMYTGIIYGTVKIVRKGKAEYSSIRRAIAASIPIFLLISAFVVEIDWITNPFYIWLGEEVHWTIKIVVGGLIGFLAVESLRFQEYYEDVTASLYCMFLSMMGCFMTWTFMNSALTQIILYLVFAITVALSTFSFDSRITHPAKNKKNLNLKIKELKEENKTLRQKLEGNSSQNHSGLKTEITLQKHTIMTEENKTPMDFSKTEEN